MRSTPRAMRPLTSCGRPQRPDRLISGAVPSGPVRDGHCSSHAEDDAWTWTRWSGSPEDILAAEVTEGAGRTVRVVDVDDAVFVLGSTQSAPTSAPWPTVRRRSGGGGVLLVPGEVLWVDLIIPRSDDWWDDDVGRAAHVIGDAWARTLDRLGLVAAVHRGPLQPSRWSGALCFAGLGPGEVTVDDRKVVGIAQRRTRAGACFQCAVPLVAVGRSSAAAAGLRGDDADQAAAHLAKAVGAVALPASAVVDALRAVLAPAVS
jgi:hypothetical protein